MIIAVAIVGGLALYIYKPTYSVTLNGEFVGYIEDKANLQKKINEISKYNVKNILLIGGTGYLGAHIISSFLKNKSGTLYCLIRQKNNESPRYRTNRRLE